MSAPLLTRPEGVQAPPRWRRPRWMTVGVLVVLLVLVVNGLLRLDVESSRLWGSPARTWDFISRGFPPNLDRAPQLGEAMWETLEIAVIGTVIGVLLSVPVSLLAARNIAPKPVAALVRVVLSTLRAVPDLVWAMIFVISVGLGPLAGILAIAVDVLGFAGRFFAERVEEVDRGPLDALRSTGAKTSAVVVGAVLPASLASFTGTSLYCLEKSVRGAVVLGLVGAGGIGVELNVAFQMRQFDTAFTIIILILVVVLVAERLSSAVRRRMIGADQLV
ncbi:phosphonate ABC transporter, permease protein PhnE [Nesterenkonia xinjiangensis]|uniref:Phosphonate transport system permease protein n=1 Tax=Nesterenkonia xinjiangensis TaxID=225327 RepID=A0A7Z0GM03_9MICC|nr:phosphonate transport system permease protein [Nesterenkonia xinjiangensis]